MRQSRFPLFLTTIAALFLAGLLVLSGATPVGAVPTCTTDCYVSPTGNDANDGATAATPLLTIQVAVNALTSGGTVHLAAGTYNQDTLLNKPLTLDGDGPLTTIIDAIGIGLDISADDVTVQDLTVTTAATHGARVYRPAGTVLRPAFNNVHFTANTARGLEFSGNATDVVVTNCVFDGNTTGIRSASTAVITGIDVTDSTFKNHTNAGSGIGIYQASDGNPGNMSDLHVTNSLFENNGFAGIYGEEFRDVVIEGSTFQNETRGLLLYDAYTASATPTGPLTFTNNQFTNHTAAAIQLQLMTSGLDAGALLNGILIDNNTFTQNAALPASNWAQIDLRLLSSVTHAHVLIQNNAITFNGGYGAGATALYAIKLRGGPDMVFIENNTLDGGNIGANGGTPATAGLYVVSNVSFYGPVKAATAIYANHNAITNFPNGVAVYDEVGAAYGALPAGATLAVNRNDLSNNSYGVNSGAGEDADATCNWWGAADGPGPVGPGSGSNVTTDVIFAPWLNTPDLDGPCFEGVYVSADRAGVTDDGLAFGPHDIIVWNGTAWVKWFDGSDAYLTPNGKNKHSIGAIYIPDPAYPDVLMSFAQDARFVPGITGKVDGVDLVHWDGGVFSMFFDGQDVGLSVLTDEKIDAVHWLDGSYAPPALAAAAGGCGDYLLLSTQGPGRVQNYDGAPLKFGGEDVLGFCMTASGTTTAGKWILVLDGSAEGTPRNAISGLSGNDDGSVLFVTTRGAFTVDTAVGGHSMIYAYASGDFSGPYWRAADVGLHQKVAGLHVELLP